MDDDYELVPRTLINKLREENRRLKEQLANISIKNNTAKLANNKQIDGLESTTQIVQEFHRGAKEDNNLILKGIDEIKILNKSILNNVVLKTKDIDTRLDKLINPVSELVKALIEAIDNISSNSDVELKGICIKLEKMLSGNNFNINNTCDANNADVLKKLDDIDRFMQNLRILLSYVKPNDVRMEKNKLMTE